MRKFTKRASILLMLILVTVLVTTGCGKKTEVKTEETKSEETKSEETKSEAAKPEEAKPEEAKAATTRTFTDSVGRSVELPATIKGVAPSGPLAQIVLYTACPDELMGIAADFTEEAKKYIPEKYVTLPKFGQFYGKNANLNMEALVKARPDVIIDIGQAKKTVKEDIDALQAQLGIPVVFIESSISTMDVTYTKLGELLGQEEKMKELAAYSKKTIEHANEITKNLKEEEKVGVYLALGEAGLNTNAQGSFHAEVLDLVGARNIADVEPASKGGGSEVSFEQIAAWNPTKIIAFTEELYTLITTDPLWQNIAAVQNQEVYKVPTAPYNYLSDPPSVNRMIGINWLGHLLYPDKYEFDNETVKQFYQMFYHVELTEDQINEVLMHATTK